MSPWWFFPVLVLVIFLILMISSFPIRKLELLVMFPTAVHRIFFVTSTDMPVGTTVIITSVVLKAGANADMERRRKNILLDTYLDVAKYDAEKIKTFLTTG